MFSGEYNVSMGEEIGSATRVVMMVRSGDTKRLH